MIGKVVIPMPPCPADTCSYRIRPGDSLWLIAQRFHITTEAIMSANPTLQEKNLCIGQVICIPKECVAQRMPPQSMPECISMAQQKLSNHMRLLWEQHVYWTRLFILSAAFGLPDTKAVADRLLRNPKDFEEALKPFYGKDIAAKFAALFTSHLTIAAELVMAAKAGDSAAAADADKRWYENADEIADFLGSINPYWSAQEWRKMLYDHLAMTKVEAVDILTQKYGDSINAFGSIEQQALMMADAMTQGLVKQFLQQFR
ncbi:MAG: LysM peptidoglycan-binding domain-containing protein [Oscillospiraceae bacterium]|nr:LysM peptidoglycan-binding domain-containing protein [Oscillospiraceae bacterium]